MSRTAASIMLVALATAVWAPALVFAPGYGEPAVVRVLLGCAAVGSVAVTTVLARRRFRIGRIGALVVGLPVLMGAVVVLAAWRPGQVPGAVPGATDALLNASARVLSTTPPAPTTVDTVTLPLAATWLAGAASALAIRTARPLLALLPSVVLLTGAVVLAGPDARPGYVAVALLAAAGAVLLGTFTPVRSGDGRDGRRILRALGVAVLLGVLAAFAAPPVLADWSRRPIDPRAAAKPPSTTQEAINPLSYLPGWSARPRDPLLTVSTDRPVELRWVTLSEFTGQTWLPEKGYGAVGEFLPPTVPAPPRSTSHRATVTVTGLPGPWLPAVGNPRRVEGVPVGYDPESGTIFARDGRSEGHRYAVTGDVPGWRPSDAARALVPTDPAFDRYRELPPGAPARIGQVAAAVAGTDSPYRQAVRLAEYLRRDYVLDARGRGGHGYPNIGAFLVMPGEGRRGTGTADQFASAFALLARAAGLASRVCVGFGPGQADGARGRQVHTGDAVAWGEVYFDRVGWVPFDVIPGTRTTSGSQAAPEGAAPTQAPDARASARARQARPAAPAAPSRRQAPLASDDSGTWVVAGTALVVLLLVTPLVAVPALRRRRTRRRLHQGTPADRILGAWAELMDGLRLAGRPVPAAHTAKDVAAGHPSLEWLAVQVNVVGFGPAGEVEPGQAKAAADLADTYVRTLRRSRSRLRRALWWLDPRPLFW